MGARENGEERNDHSTHVEVERHAKLGKEAESEYEAARDSFSSQGESNSNEDTKVKRVSRVPKKLAKKETKPNSSRLARTNSTRIVNKKLQYISPNNSPNKAPKPSKAANGVKTVEVQKPETVEVTSCPSSDVSEETNDKAIEGVATDDKAIEVIATDDKAIEVIATDDKGIEGVETSEIAIEEAKEIDVLDEAPKCDQSTGTDDEIADTEQNILDDDNSVAYEKNDEKSEELESKIEKLKQELREVAALEVSLYSIVPEHVCSSHKLHTPARRLSRLYIHASKFWSPDKKASVAKNSVSGLVLVAKSCGNDVPRLTFWLSNTIVLREIIAQTFGISSQSTAVMNAFTTNSKSNARNLYKNSLPMRWKMNSSGKQARPTITQFPNHWQETGTVLAALEKIESWIFSRIVESVWWQALTPCMQTPIEDSSTPSVRKPLGHSSADQHQSTFCIDLWKAAFCDAFSRICPLRAGGHECGCLPVLAKLVMEQCVARLDVALFNAILRESENEIPSDPISDPILDSTVLPIPAGNLSFGSGAQLKNAVGSWSRLLTDMFGMDGDDSRKDGQGAEGDGNSRRDGAESNSFKLLNELSDLLMLPKDMLLEKSIRKEVCPSIGLPLVTRILCNFTPDEFCPDPVPGIVLEELNSESLLERFTEKNLISTFPCTAAPVAYRAPSLEGVAEKSGSAEVEQRALMVQRRGYTSDDDLDDLGSPLMSLYDRSSPPSPCNGVAHFSARQEGAVANVRYELLREVWSERRD
ncbi:unnamed protein product [Triticum turgidum subsp. durum]|uniref:Dilute domain-containing protein n=1 Tax=Triticum turgidum subsp. durum TaxID=4567 RepID=A0A9R0TRZ5_TRITD|nr:unnamed protein product [Triticum turgidum subsp. durum]